MTHLTNIKNLICHKQTAITLGNFDGIHLGHQQLLSAVIDCGQKNDLGKVAFSFKPHPSEYFTKKKFKTLLTSEEKGILLQSLGVDTFVEYPFDKNCAEMDPEFFIKNILVDKLNCKVIVVGEGYCFGKGKQGNNQLMLKIGEKYGIKIKIVPIVTVDGEKVSSSDIRNLVLLKNFKKAQSLMTRPYFVWGRVVEGRKLGRTINFPTVNIIPNERKILPENGVYISKIECRGNLYNGITNIGVNPTVNGYEKRIETHIYNFNSKIYDENITVYFCEFVRPEIKFDSFIELKNQIAKDFIRGEIYFNEENRMCKERH